jgi:hypothetical protein
MLFLSSGYCHLHVVGLLSRILYSRKQREENFVYLLFIYTLIYHYLSLLVETLSAKRFGANNVTGEFWTSIVWGKQ